MKEKVVIVGVASSFDEVDINDSLDELTRLVDSCDGQVVERFIQRREVLDRKFFIGKGKLEEISLFIDANDIDTIVFDQGLFPSQQRDIENFLDVKVIDRSRLILDIFAKRANTSEGKLQVELAQLEYMLPRLTGKGIELSRQKGGIGTKGPGEKKLEVDARKIRNRIIKLKKELKKVKASRDVQRTLRYNLPIPLISLIGYTNAGKSTLLNYLTKSKVLTQDKLFATLDPTIRKLRLPSGQRVLFADTVGFINNLPHELIAAFRATLEETRFADILIHVVDGASTNYETQIQAVNKVLEDLSILDKQIILVFNKIDIMDKNLKKILQTYSNRSFCVSAKTGQGLDKVLEQISAILQKTRKLVTLHILYKDSNIINFVCENGIVAEKSHAEEYTIIKVYLTDKMLSKVKKYIHRAV